MGWPGLPARARPTCPYLHSIVLTLILFTMSRIQPSVHHLHGPALPGEDLLYGGGGRVAVRVQRNHNQGKELLTRQDLTRIIIMHNFLTVLDLFAYFLRDLGSHGVVAGHALVPGPGKGRSQEILRETTS